MRFNPIPLIACLFCVGLSLHGQDSTRYRLQLRNSSFIPSSSLQPTDLTAVEKQMAQTKGKYFLIVQLTEMPLTADRAALQKEGIHLLDYIPHFAYTAVLTRMPDSLTLRRLKVRALIRPSAAQKMQPALSAGIFPAHAVKIPGTINIWISFPALFTSEEVKQELQKRNIDLVSDLYQTYRILEVRISQSRLSELASLGCIDYIEPQPHEAVTLNNKSTANSRANVLQSALGGQRNLSGEGVVIGIGDDATTVTHGDFTGRVIDRAALSGNAHGVHVTGISAGAGILNEKFRGYAPKTVVVSQVFERVLNYTPTYITDYGMVLTNNSYGNIVNDCTSFGQYTLYSRVVDQHMLQYNNLQHVFAAGNSATIGCSPYPASFGTVLGDYQSAKNVITVGSTNELGSSSSFSSRGPVRDGRIKPEIVAQGGVVFSTWPVNIYSSTNGTSMAAPAVTGGLTLLYQRYRQLNGNANPKNGLMKALVCNGATDLGNPGPDYAYGFGWMNLLRSVTMMEAGTYYSGAINTGNEQTQTISVPANTAQLKIMLYWNDPVANLLSAQTLVNDLDLEVTDPFASTLYPYRLDTLPANVNNPAVTGADHINNIEQVVVTNPSAGTNNYTIRIKGTSVPQSAPQEYFVVYDFIPVSTVLTYPMGGERLKPNDSIYISWDSYGDPVSAFTLEYSLDGGGNWTVIDNNVPAATRLYKWFLPNVATHQARVRITRNTGGIQATGQDFVILGTPVVTLDPVQCPTYIKINWTSVTGANQYEVMLMQHSGIEMQQVAIVTGNSYTFSGLSRDSFYYVSVRAHINSIPGLREYTVSRGPATGTCTGTISDNDIMLDSLVTPSVSGRKSTSTEFGTTVPITIRIRNLDDAPTPGNITASYSINGGPPVVETITSTIAGGATLDYTFSTPANLSVIGNQTLVVGATQAGDPVAANDVFTANLKQLDNPVIDLSSTFLDDLETAPVFFQSTKRAGLNGLDRYDFVTSNSYGRIRSFINTGLAYSGSKMLTLDVSRFVGAGVVDSLTGTYNLSNGYNAASDDIRLDFRYKNHGQITNAANRVWVRGDDTKPWLQVYDLFANQDPANGSFKLSQSIELSDTLVKYAQNYSTSFQVRWGQWGQHMAADNESGDGYSFDDIRLYKVTDDMQLMSIDTPTVNSCGLSATTPVRITVRNSRNSVINTVPVRYRVNGGAWVGPENIPSIPANDTVQYTFTQTANLSATGNYLIEAEVVLVTDTYHENDTASVTITNSAVIAVSNSQPYLFDFETDNGGWYASADSYWEYGTPASLRIARAASGSKAWKTRLVGNYDDNKTTYLYTPCYDISTLSNPTLSFHVALDLEDCGGVLCDGAYMEYSVDGINWLRLGANGQGKNWYNKSYTGNNLWSVQNYQRWHVATIPLIVIPIPTAQLTALRFRYVVRTDASVNRDGMAIDDFHIYNNAYGIYDQAANSGDVTVGTVNGTSWIDFLDGGTGKLVASVNPDGQDLGSTTSKAYVYTGITRINSLQYYHNRNITIKPTNVSLPDSATVRFYFLDTEMEALISSTNCGVCTKPAQAVELGVTKYSDPNDANEDGTLANNAGGLYSFIIPAKVKMVPFDNGYYAQFRVRDFSEFWLNNGWFNGITPLPLKLITFTARKQANQDVLLKWVTADELNVDRFDIELAAGNEAFNANQFIRLGFVTAKGTAGGEQRYQFPDTELNKTGTRYYRLRIIDKDGTVRYSSVRPVSFSTEVKWQLFPNPSDGLSSLLLQGAEGGLAICKLYDGAGRLVKQFSQPTTGFEQKIWIDIREKSVAPGLYLLEVNTGERRESFRLVKQ